MELLGVLEYDVLTIFKMQACLHVMATFLQEMVGRPGLALQYARQQLLTEAPVVTSKLFTLHTDKERRGSA